MYVCLNLHKVCVRVYVCQRGSLGCQLTLFPGAEGEHISPELWSGWGRTWRTRWPRKASLTWVTTWALSPLGRTKTAEIVVHFQRLDRNTILLTDNLFILSHLANTCLTLLSTDMSSVLLGSGKSTYLPWN